MRCTQDMLLKMHAGCKLLRLRWHGRAVVSSTSSSSRSKQALQCLAKKRCVQCLSRLVLALLRYGAVTKPSIHYALEAKLLL
jgi:hypothetical protein